MLTYAASKLRGVLVYIDTVRPFTWPEQSAPGGSLKYMFPPCIESVWPSPVDTSSTKRESLRPLQRGHVVTRQFLAPTEPDFCREIIFHLDHQDPGPPRPPRPPRPPDPRHRLARDNHHQDHLDHHQGHQDLQDHQEHHQHRHNRDHR